MFLIGFTSLSVLLLFHLSITFFVFSPLENSEDSYLCFRLALLHSVSYFFFLYRSPSSSLCTVFDSILSNIDEVFLINPSANVFVFGDFNVYHKDWLTYSGGTDRSGEVCHNFSTSNDQTQMVFLITIHSMQG